MAVVFISPKKRQQSFFIAITIMVLLFLVAISFGVFLSKPKEVLMLVIWNKPKISIDMSVFDLAQFKSLQPFTEMQIYYSYKAVTKDQKEVTGFITAISIDQARTTLTNEGMTISEIKEAEIGRDNPFTPYVSLVTSPIPVVNPVVKSKTPVSPTKK